ncbi:MAG: hypothetical protein ACXWJU_02970 [Hyphomicrobium sp.]
MARSTQAKALGLKRGPLSDATWQQLPAPMMLKLLVEIADAEKRLEAQRPTHPAHKDLAARAARDPKSGA